MTSANWAKPLFDIGQMRRICYLLPEESISDGSAAWKLETVIEDCKVSAQLCEEPRRSELNGIVQQLEGILHPLAKAAQ